MRVEGKVRGDDVEAGSEGKVRGGGEGADEVCAMKSGVAVGCASVRVTGEIKGRGEAK